MNKKDNSDRFKRKWIKSLAEAFSIEPKDRQALVDILRKSENRNLLDPDTLLMVEGALQVSEMQVRDIMIPRIQMIVVKNNADPQDILSTVIESGHSRFPVIGDDTDIIMGILLAKDLLVYFADDQKGKFNIKDMMRPPIFVPESKRLNVLLREFRSKRIHMAIVVDEYSGVSGLVTIEDILEEIVGEIVDEHDTSEEEFIEAHGRHRYTVKALTPVEEFNEYFKTDLNDEEYDTIGGIVLNAFGHVPKRGEFIDYAGFNIKILRADQRRIHLIRLTMLEKGTSVEEDVN
jgi:magnesium and cobalt transporter